MRPLAPRPPRARRPTVAGLEDRLLLSTFVVDSTADDPAALPGDGTARTAAGAITLRSAIQAADAHPGGDTILFRIPSTDPGHDPATGTWTIRPRSALPDIERDRPLGTPNPLVIDAYSQPGARVNTRAVGDDAVLTVVLDGRDVGGGSATEQGAGLRITAGDSTVRGLVIDHFASGIRLEVAGRNLVEGNFLGTDAAGTSSAGNRGYGVEVDGNFNTIGGLTPSARNVISANGSGGIFIHGHDARTQVLGNYIGTDRSGTRALGNGQGIRILDSNVNTIGGSHPGARNLISGNRSSGVELQGTFCTGNQILGNFIGVDATGARPLGNSGDGVRLFSWPRATTIGDAPAGAGNTISANGGDGIHLVASGAFAPDILVRGNFIGTDASGGRALGNAGAGVHLEVQGATHTRIGGPGPGEGNVISGNHSHGIIIQGDDTRVLGNLIGTDRTGTRALGNAGAGVRLDRAIGSTIGGNGPGAGNVISANGLAGIVVDGDRNRVLGNLIGTDRSGTRPLGNREHGVLVKAPASLPVPPRPRARNIIGGASSAEGNTLANNGGHGIDVVILPSDPSTIATLLSNRIFANAGLGIDLGNNGVTPNASLNHGVARVAWPVFPDLRLAFREPGGTRILGALHAAANATYLIQVFTSPARDPSGYGEGKAPLITRQVRTDGQGTATFSILAAAVPVGQSITATATDASGRTSEFSRALAVSAGPTTRCDRSRS